MTWLSEMTYNHDENEKIKSKAKDLRFTLVKFCNPVRQYRGLYRSLTPTFERKRDWYGICFSGQPGVNIRMNINFQIIRWLVKHYWFCDNFRIFPFNNFKTMFFISDHHINFVWQTSSSEINAADFHKLSLNDWVFITGKTGNEWGTGTCSHPSAMAGFLFWRSCFCGTIHLTVTNLALIRFQDFKTIQAHFRVWSTSF